MIIRSISDLVDVIVERGGTNERALVAVAGPPGSGKSTLCEELLPLLEAGGHSATVVPMDGFHLDNATLQGMNLLDRKGAPETFDAAGFVDLIRRLRANEGPASVPLFDRDADCVRPDARTVDPRCRFVLIEGNYLLLDQQPWSRLPEYFDCAIRIDAPMDVLRERLIARWLEQGFDRNKAEIKALGNDIPNAELVVSGSMPSDVIYRPD